MNTKIPTAEEMEMSDKYDSYQAMMIDFARMHVEAALKAASEQARAYVDGNGEWMPVQSSASINKQSILNAYPKELIQ